ncbi:hypothetical protein CCACVL1_06779 [Corchorus capsularis]|uniref:Uncharacterized protein n=1 Tax=Corchorus capsularis TaxID=210143 RepID=A0A1R3JD07_COCAP|nr:hypothetical protein CCACVL1_06779 [Corchorus capsularis]
MTSSKKGESSLFRNVDPARSTIYKDREGDTSRRRGKVILAS